MALSRVHFTVYPAFSLTALRCIASKANYRNAIKTLKDVPGPSSLPIFGDFYHHLPGGMFYKLDDRSQKVHLHNIYGPIVKVRPGIGTLPLLYLFDPESSSQLLRGENTTPVRNGFESLNYYRRYVRKSLVTEDEGEPTGLLTEIGKPWRTMRTTVNQPFLQPKTIKLYAPKFDEVAKAAVQKMQQLQKSNMVREKIKELIHLWSVECVGVVSLGCRLGCFDENLTEDSPASRLVRCLEEVFIITNTLTMKPSTWQWIPTPTFKRAMVLYEEQETIARYFIQRAIQDLQNNRTSNDEKGILEKLLAINPNRAEKIAIDTLFAGVETVSNSLLGALYLLATNPEKQKRLREELRSGKDKTSYVKACLKETWRMLPTAPATRRITTNTYDLMGYEIPPNVRVEVRHQEMSSMERHFPRAREFLPERWLAPPHDPLSYKHTHPFVYMPFGYGTRSCIARRISELELEIFLSRVIEKFHVEWVGPHPRVDEELVNLIRGPYNYILKDVDSFK